MTPAGDPANGGPGAARCAASRAGERRQMREAVRSAARRGPAPAGRFRGALPLGRRGVSHHSFLTGSSCATPPPSALRSTPTQAPPPPSSAAVTVPRPERTRDPSPPSGPGTRSDLAQRLHPPDRPRSPARHGARRHHDRGRPCGTAQAGGPARTPRGPEPRRAIHAQNQGPRPRRRCGPDQAGGPAQPDPRAQRGQRPAPVHAHGHQAGPPHDPRRCHPLDRPAETGPLGSPLRRGRRDPCLPRPENRKKARARRRPRPLPGPGRHRPRPARARHRVRADPRLRARRRHPAGQLARDGAARAADEQPLSARAGPRPAAPDRRRSPVLRADRRSAHDDPRRRARRRRRTRLRRRRARRSLRRGRIRRRGPRRATASQAGRRRRRESAVRPRTAAQRQRLRARVQARRRLEAGPRRRPVRPARGVRGTLARARGPGAHPPPCGDGRQPVGPGTRGPGRARAPIRPMRSPRLAPRSPATS